MNDQQYTSIGNKYTLQFIYRFPAYLVVVHSNYWRNQRLEDDLNLVYFSILDDGLVKQLLE